jgi:hypothetical protein
MTVHQFNLAAVEFVQRAVIDDQASFVEINMSLRFLRPQPFSRRDKPVKLARI